LERLASLDFRSLLCGDGFQLLRGGREALSVFIASNQP
jgi:hypothetical protein